MNRIWLVLRKDALVLRRSPLLFGILIAYPVAIALLVGLVAGYASSKPRVALVDEDNLPATVVLGGKRFHVDNTIKQVSRNVRLVRLSADDAQRQLRNGEVVAVVTVPPGFIATLEGMVKSPRLEVQLSHGTISSRVDQQVQALVYSLNRQLQRAYIATNLKYVTLILSGGKGTFLGEPIDVIGLQRSEKLLHRMPQTHRVHTLEDFVHDARLALANTGDALRATAHPIQIAHTGNRGRTSTLDLTDREKEVTRLLAAGKSNRQIGHHHGHEPVMHKAAERPQRKVEIDRYRRAEWDHCEQEQRGDEGHRGRQQKEPAAGQRRVRPGWSGRSSPIFGR